jgi:hypothetical protein
MNIPRRAAANFSIFAGPGGTSKSQGQLYGCKILQNYIIQVAKRDGNISLFAANERTC